MILSIVSITPPIAASAIPPCLLATIKVFSKFGALQERSYHEIIWLQILKTLREKKNAVRELRRCNERVHIFQCLVMYISRDNIYYVHARARYMYPVTILRLSHVCGVPSSRMWRKSRFLELSISGREQKGIEDAMDEIPDKIRTWEKTQDELVIAVEDFESLKVGVFLP